MLIFMLILGVVFLLVRLVIMEDGTVLVTVPIMTFLVVSERALLPSILKFLVRRENDDMYVFFINPVL
jgi:hypothetical protein